MWKLEEELVNVQADLVQVAGFGEQLERPDEVPRNRDNANICYQRCHQLSASLTETVVCCELALAH